MNGPAVPIGYQRRVTDDEFIPAWNASATVDEAAGNLRMKKNTAIVRASVLRGRGHDLKKFTSRQSKPGGSRITISLRVDPDVAENLRALPGGYGSWVNDILRIVLELGPVSDSRD